MRCPSCGLEIDQPNLDRCPRCGRALTTTPTPAPQTSEASEASESVASVAPGAPSANAAPPADPAPQNPYGPFMPYGSYAPPSGYGQPYSYGQPPATPSYPPPGYPQPALNSPATMPPPPRKKPRTRLIIGIVAAVAVVVLAACGWGVVATVQALHLPAQSAVPRETPNEVYSNDFSSNAAGWANDSRCFWKSDGYHVTSGYVCDAPIGNYSDVDIKVTVKQVSGPTNSPMGIAFHLLPQTGEISQYYLFNIAANGRWGFTKCNSNSCSHPIDFRSESAINQGTGASNSLEVYAKGAHMDFFINGKAVGSLDDASYSTGAIGLLAGDAVECVFTNLFIGELD